MKIATVLNVHSDPSLIIDTCSSIFAFCGPNVLLLVNGSTWEELKALELSVCKVRGFRHDVPKAPYRNVALGLKMVCEQWPTVDWYCYVEYDVLFASTRFQTNLRLAQDKNVWMLGNCGRVDEVKLPLVEAMLGEKLKSTYYLLGCCQFFHRNFMEKLLEIDFFDRFLFLTNSFSDGFFPAYSGYDISEHLYPTLCRHFGGNVGVFATWDEGKWHGAYKYFPMRWKPEIDEIFSEASIIHPVKSLNHPVRIYHRERRKSAI